VSHDNRLSYPH